MASKDLFYRGRQIVIPRNGENTAKVLEGKLMGFQKGLLACVRVRTVKSSATGHASHTEDVKFLPLSV
jgi:hypothetical protein